MKTDLLFFVHCFCSVLILEVNCKIQYETIPSEDIRATTYSPKIVSKTCTLIPDDGPCRGNIRMYYFDPASLKCNIFLWGGCQGNGNRFKTEEECIGKCLSKPNAGPHRPRWCSLSFDYGFCFGNEERWYYDHLWRVCKKTLYSGCGGNKNNFYNREQCESVCRFGHEGLMRVQEKKDNGGMSKILIINPENATKKRGRIQKTVPTTPSNAKVQ
uniref:BPTI/Kunitz inhibitor domain-containing protein n=1 Tax=Bombyx mori TaxID=7091 RepID=A0A8R2QSB0_BOMMO|nr:carboxypeptidase inhibitor SmCI-like [Bombyx mori]